MAIGNIIINVFADNIAQPVIDADIEITGKNMYRKVKTNTLGKTSKIPLDAPDVEYSLTPQKEVKPYAEYTLRINRNGLQGTVIEGVEIFEGQTSIQNVILASEPENHTTPRIYQVPQHTLWGDYPPKLIESSIKNMGTASAESTATSITIPEYIIVHDGIPTNNAASNFKISFVDYIKNVTCSEIYCTWPVETIKANILAIISFTLNRIFTNWYPSKGYPFTITSSTVYDQKYIHRRSIFQNISDLVDEIFQQYLKLPDITQPYFAQSDDGIRINNTGWMSKWGSKELGDKGFDALSILKHYYNKDIYIETAKNVNGVDDPFPGENLSLNSCGEDVQVIQRQINVINGSYSAINQIIPADGNFGNTTEDSLRKLQQVFDIPITGIVNRATWYRIARVYAEIMHMLNGIYD
ncbi:MAG: peptidoglycan-binding protein [Coprobacillaceae bacterium]